MDIIFISWIVWLLIGVLVGSQKGQLASGIIWSLLLGPIGVLIVVCLPNKTKETERNQQLAFQQQQIRLQQQQLEELKKLRESPPSPRIVEESPRRLRIAKNGEDIGELGYGVVKTMLNNGQLGAHDLYYDPNTENWFPLADLR